MTVQISGLSAPATLPISYLKSYQNLPHDGLDSTRLSIFHSDHVLEPDPLVHSFIEHQADKTPQATAALFETHQKLEYRQLNELANAVARQIMPCRGKIVPIAVSRSINLVVSLLAVLKAGGAYVLLSHDAPLERNRFIIKDTKASLVIADNDTRRWFEETPVASIEDLVAQAETMSPKFRTNVHLYQSSSDIAYVIYTSGTTGVPKGVLLSHAAACTGLSALPSIDNSFRQLLCHSPSFSAAQRTILGTLCRGGTLCLASKESITLNLNDTIEKMGINSLEITPSMLKLVNPDEVSRAVKKITLGGEPVGPALVEAWAGRVELVSAYGLSECTQLNMRQNLSPKSSSRLIGRPTDSTTIHILVPGSLEESPRGVAGELCLGGTQLAEGYLNLPDKTSEVFIDNPFENGRLYRTGDVAVVTESNQIELVGRIDQQTKIDGQRVEPNESNSIIEVHPGVLQSSVVSAFVLGRKALVAVLVTESGWNWMSLVRELREILNTRLPSFTIPRYWIQQDTMPLNSNGKVDISALVKKVASMDSTALISPSSTPHNSLSSTSTRSPSPSKPAPESNPFLESKIIQICSDVLSIPPEVISLDASFQELGGSSLDAIIVASKLRNANISVTVPDILQSITLREIATRCKESDSVKVTTLAPFSLLPEGHGLDLTAIDDAYPVTPLQEGVLASSLLGNQDYVYRRIYKIQGVSAFQVRSALKKVLARNSILRTTFSPWKKGFLQVVNKTAALPWKLVKGESLDNFLRDSAQADFSLDGPLIRSSVFNSDILVLEMHHALFDYWSSQFIIEDTIAILQGNEDISRAPFNQYVAYQQNAHDAGAKVFWQAYLKSASPTLLDFPKPIDALLTNGPFVLTSKLPDNLATFTRSRGITLGALVHTAWALTLSSALESDDVTFATAFSGRDADVDGILALNGPTLCTVPMRVSIDETESLLGLARRVQSNLWNLSRYSHSGMRNALQSGSLNSRAFNSMVNLLIKQVNAPEELPLVPSSIHGHNFTQYITIEINERDSSLVKMLVPFPAHSTVYQELLDNFAKTIEATIAYPESPVTKLASFAEQRPAAPSSFIEPKRVFGLAHSAFELHAVSSPSKVALRSSSGEILTYEELDSKANRFAASLIELGVQQGEMIPLYMEKSIYTIIAILGILKAGTAFTPLDPLNPYERNAFIIKDVGASRIVSDRKNVENGISFGTDLIIIDEIDLTPNDEHDLKLPELTEESPIYSIYTSGSTGLPKGVLIHHSAVTASTEGMIEATGVTSDWNALWVLNYVFDASYYDVFTILSVGATLCLAPQEELLSNLSMYINDLNIEQVMLTPTITKLISGGPAEVPRLKVLNVCGEKIDINILEWARSVDVYNGYGPTEATILMTVSHVKPDTNLNSIGFPMKHVTAVILPQEGGNLKPVEKGAVGELCVLGPQLAKGYINRPEQTSASFIHGIDGDRLYRTGDLARWAPDGSIECLGRKDYQIKLNGFRIELGEIENAILMTGDVDAVVVSVAEVHGKRQLVAFCIFKGDHRPGIEGPLPAVDRLQSIVQLKSQLTTISHYMMPALFLPYQSFPRLPSGKANRKELNAYVEFMKKAEITQYIPHDGNMMSLKPVSTDQERIMQQVWSSVLDEPLDSIGSNSVFLSLGGDSISAINLASACRKLSYDIPVSQILLNPTLGEQAKQLKPIAQKLPTVEMKFDIPDTILSAIKNAGLDFEKSIEDVYPCGPGQKEFLIQGTKKPQFWNLTACRSLPRDFDLDYWKEVTEKLTARNQILRAMYYQADHNDISSWYQIILKDPILDYEYKFFTSEAERLRHTENLRDENFTFGKPNIKYLVLHSVTDGSRTLCIKVDHASYDGTLLRIFDDQFKAICSGEDDIDVNHFKSFVNWTHSVDRDEVLDYWMETLDGYAPIHNLPLEPLADGLRFSEVNTNVDTVAANFGVTTSTIFQAAYSLVVGKLSSTNDVLVDNLLTGRNADVENPQTLNGTCANFLPFRSQISEDESVEQFLKDTQAHFWDTTDHGTVGLHDIYDALGKNRNVNSAKLLYCFQPFNPAPRGSTPDHIRWVVMAQSQVFMKINYALMVEVQKTVQGHKLKFQWDRRVLTVEQIDVLASLFDDILAGMGKLRDGKLVDLMSTKSELDGVWKA